MPAAIPIFTLATAAVGIGASVYGGIQQSKAASQQNALQQKVIADQMKQQELQKQAMELDARRKQMQALRNQQRARSLALSAGVNQGAQFGTGLQGGYGQISGQTNTNLVGISQGLQLGEQNYNLVQDISQTRIGIGQAESSYYTGAALSGLGSKLIGNLPTINRLGQYFTGPTSTYNGFGTYNNPSNYGTVGQYGAYY